MRLPFAPLLLALAASSAALAQTPAGGEFRVNSYTSARQISSSVAMDGSGGFVVIWMSDGQDGDSYGLFGQRYAPDGTPKGSEFQVNTYTTSGQLQFASHGVSSHPDGGFVAVWSSGPNGRGLFGQRYDRAGARLGGEFQIGGYAGSSAVTVTPDGGFMVVYTIPFPPMSFWRVVGRRFDAAGAPLGGEFQISSFPEINVFSPVAARDAAGNFVVAWNGYRQDGSQSSVVARRLDAGGNPRGAEFLVNTYTTGSQDGPAVAVRDDGSFVIAWGGLADAGGPDAAGVFARRFEADGTPAGAEFQVNAFTTSTQNDPSVAIDDGGRVVISWTSYLQDGDEGGIYARRYNAAGAPMGPEFRVNSYTSGRQWRSAAAASPSGNLVVAWESSSQDGSSYGIYGQRMGGLVPEALVADGSGNGVLEPAETAVVAPSWRNVNGALLTFGGGLSGFTGPAGAAYTITDAAADYGSVPNGAAGSCGGDCYALAVTADTRPVLHWDATVLETITPLALGPVQRWILHLGGSFTDVPASSPFYRFIETLLHHSILDGCGAGRYCPADPMTRDQLAVSVLLSREGALYRPPPCAPPDTFADVPAGSPFCPWVEELARRGVVGGCGGGNYCPFGVVTREQMATIVLKTLDPSQQPAACAAPTLFADVPATSPFCRWIEALARRGVIGGCGGGNYCPSAPATREQAGVFLAATFELRLYGP